MKTLCEDGAKESLGQCEKMMKLRWVGAYLGDVCEEPVTYMKSSKVYEARLDGMS